MAFELDENEKRLYELLMQVPPDMQRIRSELVIGKYASGSFPASRWSSSRNALMKR